MQFFRFFLSKNLVAQKTVVPLQRDKNNRVR